VRPIAACGTGSVFLSLNKAMEGITKMFKKNLLAFKTTYSDIEGGKEGEGV